MVSAASWQSASARRSVKPSLLRTQAAPEDQSAISVWHGLWAPKGTPKAIIAKLNRAVVDALANPTVQNRLADLGQGLPTREQQTPEALHAFQKAEIEKWWPIVKAAHITGE
jgi:tripartite-type tricarboxylate transporter receptor subunit TctC